MKKLMSIIKYNQAKNFSENLIFFIIRFSALRKSCSGKLLLSLGKMTYSSVYTLQYLLLVSADSPEKFHLLSPPMKCKSREYKNTFWNIFYYKKQIKCVWEKEVFLQKQQKTVSKLSLPLKVAGANLC